MKHLMLGKALKQRSSQGWRVSSSGENLLYQKGDTIFFGEA
jgi:hypothetical protein